MNQLSNNTKIQTIIELLNTISNDQKKLNQLIDESLIDYHQFLKVHIQITFPIYFYSDHGFEIHFNNKFEHIISKQLMQQSHVLLLAHGDNNLEGFNQPHTYYSKRKINETLFNDFVQHQLEYVFTNKIQPIIKLKEQYFQSIFPIEDLNNHKINIFIDNTMEDFINDLFLKIHMDFLNKTSHILKSSILPDLMKTISKNNIKYAYHSLSDSIGANKNSQLEKVTKI